MPVYIYKAKRGPKETVDGQIIADSEAKAVDRLGEMGLIPIAVVEKKVGQAPEVKTRAAEGRQTAAQKPALVSADLKARSQDIDTFTRQLASLMKANVPMLRTLFLISQQTESSVLKGMVSDLEKRVKDGDMLSESMKNYPRIFDNLYLSMIRSGERSGSLDEVLHRLTEHREREHEIKRKIQAAMAYPLLMIVVGIGTIFFMLTYFLPKLTVLFKSLKQTLPLPTTILLNISNFMSNNWYWFLIGLVFLIAIFGRVRPGSKKKFLFDMVKLYIPFIKRFVMDAEIAKFCRTLAMLLRNGISVYDSLALATDTLDNDALKGPLELAGKEIVNQGSTLTNSFKKIDIFPKFALNMIAVGEEGGKLEESLIEIASVYEKAVEQRIKIITTLLEPLLILAVGAIVGFIVFAMLLPIFNIGIGPQ